MTEEERTERRRKRAALLLLPLLLLGAALCFWTLFASVSLGEAQSFIPAPLGSNALANYGEDDIPGRLRSLSISIVEAVIRDRDPEEEDVGSRVEDVIDSLKSPVPTVPGAATGTPTSPPTTTSTLDPTITPTITPTASPSPLPSGTSTATDVPTAGPSPTPSKTPTPSATPLCLAPPYVKIISPLPDQRFTLAEVLPGQAFAFDPDNVDPLTCSTATAIFPDDDGEGLVDDPDDHEVEIWIEWDKWGDRSEWVTVHIELEEGKAYCPFGDIDPFCDTRDLSTGEWPDSTPINTGRHRIKAKALKDDEGVSGGWSVPVEFYIDPAPTPIPPTNTPIPATNTPVPLPVCPDISFNDFDDDAGANEVSWDIDNTSGATLTITHIDFTWPSGNGQLNWIKLDGTTVWSIVIPPNNMNENVSIPVLDGTSWKFKIKFQDDDLPSGYNITATFGATCYAEKSE